MDKKIKKICVVVSARPSYARIKTVLQEINNHPELELQLVVTASALLERYGKVIDVIRADGFEPVETVYMLVEGENLVTSAKSTGIGIVELATTFDNLKPDIVLSIADRYETIATAIAAAYLNIPVGHVQGGEVTGSIDEKVRHAVTKLANLHFVSNNDAFSRVSKMGEDPEYIYTTGCPSIDLAAQINNEDSSTFNVYDVMGGKGVGQNFSTEQGYIVVMQHPVTTEHEDAALHIKETLKAIRELKYPTFWFWPNVDAGSDSISKVLRQFREENNLPDLYFLKNLSPENFLRLLKQSRCIVGNSSVGIRECSYLGVPTVNIGIRQRSRKRGPNVVDVAYDSGDIKEAIKKQYEIGRYECSDTYGDGNAGKRIAEILVNVDFPVDKKIIY